MPLVEMLNSSIFGFELSTPFFLSIDTESINLIIISDVVGG